MIVLNTVTEPTENVRLVQPQVAVFFDNQSQGDDLALTSDRADTPDSDGDEMDDDEMDHVALRFVPVDKSILEHVYKQMCECQELNPASDMSDEEYDYDEEPVGDMPGASGGDYDDIGTGFDGHGWYGAGANPDEVQLSAEGMANLQRMLGGGGCPEQGENGDEDEMED
ncbi:hypothetical protein QR680_018389 [Steinernema hermaphroditum]|uniref:Methylosome subunit pICln n=1 Tax=Steinernema hermaphroditum TaxID=289476 RepID=A0AA39HHT9_9BILA|nr:hypothetical protein QR680_018389 [Steinernema hermaphroditum]